MINTIFEKDDFSVSDTGCFLSVPLRNDRDVMVKLEPGPSHFKGWITLSIGLIPIQWITQLFSLILIRWLVIYPVDNSIQSSKNRGLVNT